MVSSSFSCILISPKEVNAPCNWICKDTTPWGRSPGIPAPSTTSQPGRRPRGGRGHSPRERCAQLGPPRALHGQRMNITNCTYYTLRRIYHSLPRKHPSPCKCPPHIFADPTVRVYIHCTWYVQMASLCYLQVLTHIFWPVTFKPMGAYSGEYGVQFKWHVNTVGWYIVCTVVSQVSTHGCLDCMGQNYGAGAHTEMPSVYITHNTHEL